MSSQLLANVLRGETIESSHRGWVVVSNAKGEIVASAGDPDQIIFSRSILKPFQIIPHLLTGAFEKQKTSSQELAIMCSSHSAQNEHTHVIQQILDKLNLKVSDLKCGSHPPIHEETYHQLLIDKKPLTALHNNCSGKHVGMLATTIHQQLSTHNYLDYDHPIQSQIRQAIETVSDFSESDMKWGIDGCSAPNYAMPIKALAKAYAQLAQPDFLPPEYQKAVCTIRKAMNTHPHLVGGYGRLDTELMNNIPHIIAKVGAQGSLGVALLEKGLGIVMKIEDGQKRARSSIILEALNQLGVNISNQMTFKNIWFQPKITNHNKIEVGQIRVSFKLK